MKEEKNKKLICDDDDFLARAIVIGFFSIPILLALGGARESYKLQRKANEVIRKYDLNLDNKLSPQEYQECCNKELLPQYKQRLIIRRKEIDFNKDGFIDGFELSRFVD